MITFMKMLLVTSVLKTQRPSGITLACSPTNFVQSTMRNCVQSKSHKIKDASVKLQKNFTFSSLAVTKVELRRRKRQLRVYHGVKLKCKKR